jgi:hypothetical protein
MKKLGGGNSASSNSSNEAVGLCNQARRWLKLRLQLSSTNCVTEPHVSGSSHLFIYIYIYIV